MDKILMIAMGVIVAIIAVWFAIFFIVWLLVSPAHAGDNVEGPTPLEFLVPTVIEIEDLGLLPGFGGVPLIPWISDAQKLDFLDEDAPLPPAEVPLPGSLVSLLASLGVLFAASRVLK